MNSEKNTIRISFYSTAVQVTLSDLTLLSNMKAAGIYEVKKETKNLNQDVRRSLTISIEQLMWT